MSKNDIKPGSKVFLHLGVHKTGSTSLQMSLYSSALELESMGYLYPMAETRDFQHMFMDLRPGSGFDLTHAESALLRITQDSSGFDVILSSETFHVLPERDKMSLLNAVSSAFPDRELIAIVYVRRQDEILESLYNQSVKFGTEARSIMEYFAELEHALDYFDLLSGLKKSGVVNKIIAKVYSKDTIKNGNIIDDFSDTMGFTERLKQIPRNQNISMDRAVLNFKRAMNPHLRGVSIDLLQDLAGVMEDSSRIIYGREADTRIMSQFERWLVLEKFSASNEKLVKEFLGEGVVFPGPIGVRDSAESNGNFDDVIPGIMAHLFRYVEYLVRSEQSCHG